MLNNPCFQFNNCWILLFIESRFRVLKIFSGHIWSWTVTPFERFWGGCK